MVTMNRELNLQSLTRLRKIQSVFWYSTRRSRRDDRRSSRGSDNICALYPANTGTQSIGSVPGGGSMRRRCGSSARVDFRHRCRCRRHHHSSTARSIKWSRAPRLATLLRRHREWRRRRTVHPCENFHSPTHPWLPGLRLSRSQEHDRQYWSTRRGTNPWIRARLPSARSLRVQRGIIKLCRLRIFLLWITGKSNFNSDAIR